MYKSQVSNRTVLICMKHPGLKRHHAMLNWSPLKGWTTHWSHQVMVKVSQLPDRRWKKTYVKLQWSILKRQTSGRTWRNSIVFLMMCVFIMFQQNVTSLTNLSTNYQVHQEPTSQNENITEADQSWVSWPQRTPMMLAKADRRIVEVWYCWWKTSQTTTWDAYKTLWILRYLLHKLVQNFFHQQYVRIIYRYLQGFIHHILYNYCRGVLDWTASISQGTFGDAFQLL